MSTFKIGSGAMPLTLDSDSALYVGISLPTKASYLANKEEKPAKTGKARQQELWHRLIGYYKLACFGPKGKLYGDQFITYAFGPLLFFTTMGSEMPGTPRRRSAPGPPQAPPGAGGLLSSPTTPRRTRVVYSDRYIPSRSGVDLQAAFGLEEGVSGVTGGSGSEGPQGTSADDPDVLRAQQAHHTFNSVLRAELFDDPLMPSTPMQVGADSAAQTLASGILDAPFGSPTTPLRSPQRHLLSFQSPSRPSSSLSTNNDLYSLSPVRAESQRLLLSPQRHARVVSKVPYRVLDAPELADDFYLNLVDWGSQDVLAVGLGSAVYLWDSASGSVNRLCDLGRAESVCSVSWIGAGTHLAIGTNSGLVEIWDATTCKCTRTMTGHTLRASSLAWNHHVLSSGSRDRSVLHRDVREAPHYMARIEAHTQEVCGLRWNVEENKLASGANDNTLCVWDALNVSEPLMRVTEHEAAVKALAWSPHQRGVLASGGGTADRRIKMWNVLTRAKLADIDTGSQVCNLGWSTTSNEIVSTHGYSKNHVALWSVKGPQLSHVASLTGHTYRVLYLALSPDGQTVVTGAGDETLRFWNLFEPKREQGGGGSVLLDAFTRLR